MLPKYAPKRYFVGDIRDTKEEAKRMAAFKAVLELFKIKEILEDLRPR